MKALKIKIRIGLLVKIIGLIWISTAFSRLYGQEKHTKVGVYQYMTLKTAFFQIKDDFTYGLVFNGVNLAGRYTLEKTTEKKTFIYAPEISLGANYNIGAGLSLGFVPIDVFYGYQTDIIPSKPSILGAYFSTNYNWQFYPELQGGQMYWFTSIEIGPQFVLTLPVRKTSLKFIFSNSVAGFTSRPKPQTESYFTSRKFSDFVSNAHSNLQFGSYNSFNHTYFEVELLRKDKKLSFAYAFEYYGYYNEPGLNFVSHAINLIWKIGQQ